MGEHGLGLQVLQYAGPHHSRPGQFLGVFIDIHAAGLRGQPMALLWRKQRRQQGIQQVSLISCREPIAVAGCICVLGR